MPNNYEGKVKFYVNGKNENEIGQEELAEIIAVGVIRGLIKLSALGRLDIDISNLEFHPEILYKSIPP